MDWLMRNHAGADVYTHTIVYALHMAYFSIKLGVGELLKPARLSYLFQYFLCGSEGAQK